MNPQHTLMENIRHGRVVKDHNTAKVGLDLRQILDVRAVPERAVLAVVAA
jgi:aspartate carbamoyltransferase regulatory subunit